MATKLFESNWGATKEALLVGLKGTKRQTMDTVFENTRRNLAESATAGATQAGNIAVLN